MAEIFSKRKLGGLLILVVLGSLALKAICIDQGLPFHGTSDSEHVWAAIHAHADPALGESIWSDPKPRKYPLLSSWLFMTAADVQGETLTFPSAIETVRGGQILLMLLPLAAILVMPLPPAVRLAAVLLTALSLHLHQGALATKVHFLVGTFLVPAITCALWALRSQALLRFSVVHGAFGGLAASVFMTGGVAFLPLYVALIARVRQRTCSVGRAFFCAAVSTISGLSIFSVFYPSFVPFVRGEQRLLNPEFFGSYTGDNALSIAPEETWGVQGFLSYLDSAFGVDPLLWTGYLAGLVLLWRSGKWREPVWLVILLSVLPYQLILGCVATNEGRRDVVIVPLVALVAAWGWSHLTTRTVWRRIFVAMVVLAFATLAKYSLVSSRDTRAELARHAIASLPPGSSVVVDSRLPSIFDDFRILRTRNVAEQARQQIQDPESQLGITLRAAGFNEHNVADPANLRPLLRALGCNTYWANRSELDRNPDHPGHQLIQDAELVHRIDAGPAGPDFLPDQDQWLNTFRYLLWRTWLHRAAGPTVEVYRIR